MVSRPSPLSITPGRFQFQYASAFLGVASLFLAGEREVQGALIAYSSRSAFDAAAGSPVSLTDFESFATANVASGNALDGLTFTYSFGNVSLKIVDSLATTSGVKSLGTDDRDFLADGDLLDLSFAPRRGLGVYVLSSDALLDGDIRLTVGSTVASLVAASPQVGLGGGRFAWFLGVQSDDGATFTSASLTTHGGGGAFNYNLDDFVTVSVAAVPEPSSIGLLAFASILTTGFRRRRVSARG